jgi:hypothetical protein
VTAVLAAGCTTVVAGTPSAPTGAAPCAREIRLDGVDPCSLLTEEQRAALGLKAAPSGNDLIVGSVQGRRSICTMRGFTENATALGIGLVTTTGIDLWTTGRSVPM